MTSSAGLLQATIGNEAAWEDTHTKCCRPPRACRRHAVMRRSRAIAVDHRTQRRDRRDDGHHPASEIALLTIASVMIASVMIDRTMLICNMYRRSAAARSPAGTGPREDCHDPRGWTRKWRVGQTTDDVVSTAIIGASSADTARDGFSVPG
jgi:hypothetical protein